MTAKPANTDTAPTATSVSTLGDDNAATLTDWCNQVLSLRAVAKSFDAQADDIFDNKVEPLLEKLNVSNSVAAPTFTLVRSKGRSSLSATKLLENGVPMVVIEASKTVGKPSWGLRGKDEKPTTEETA